MKALMSLNFGQFPSLTVELSAIERLKINVQCCEHSNAFMLMICILADNEYSHETRMSSKFGQIGPETVDLANTIDL